MDLRLLLPFFTGLVFLSVDQSNCQEDCSKPLDVGILLDASGSIGSRRWKQVVKFAQSMVESFKVSEEGSHVAVVLYSTKTSIEVGFNTFTGAQRTAANINAKIAAVNYRNWKGLTYIDRGLKTANEELFTAAAGMRTRDEIKKILILFTDGKQTKDKDPYTNLGIAAQPMKDKGIEIYSLGVGKSKAIDKDELTQVASKPENVYTAENFDELQTLAFRISRASCGVAKPVPQEPSTTILEKNNASQKLLEKKKKKKRGS